MGAVNQSFVGRLRGPLACLVLGAGVLAARPAAPDEALPDPIVVDGGRARIERSFDALCRAHSASVWRVEAATDSSRPHPSLAVAVDGSHALAKVSELGNIGFHVVDPEGERHAARIVATDVATDLALIEIQGVALEPIAFATDEIDWSPGRWIAAAGPGGTCLAVGAVSVGPREIAIAFENRGLLGVYLDEAGGQGARIDRLVRGGAARAVGLRTGDLIVAIDRRVIGSTRSAQRALGRTRPGQEVLLTVEREGERFDRTVRMGGRQLDDDASEGRGWQPERHTADTVDVSVRRDGFDSAVQHDAHLDPNECLSPAVDVKGRVVGLNVARMDRPGSLALPVAEVERALVRLRAEAAADAESDQAASGESAPDDAVPAVGETRDV